MTRQIIQGTALSQSGRNLVVLPGASIRVIDPSDGLAELFDAETGGAEQSNPVTATGDGSYSFWVEESVAYYDLITTYNGRSVTERVEILTGGGDGTDQTARDAAAAAQTKADANETAIAAIAAGAKLFSTTTLGLAGTSNDELFLVQEEPGTAIYENDNGTAVRSGFLGEVQFDTPTSFFASTLTGFIDGQIIRTRDLRGVYQVVTTGEHKTTAGGVKVIFLPGDDGKYHSSAAGTIGPGDSTDDLRAVLVAAANGTFVIDRPEGGEFISDRLIPATNTAIEIQPGTTFNVISGGSRAIQIQVPNVSLRMYGAKIVMDGSQSSHSLYINAPAESITVEGGDILGSGGSGDDCIYVGGDIANGLVAKNIVMRNVNVAGNGGLGGTRNGLSLVAVDGFYAENCSFSDGGGSAQPSAGIDVEANGWLPDGTSAIKNVHFKRCQANNSSGPGVLVQFGADCVFEDHISANNGNSGYVVTSNGSIVFKDSDFRDGDRLGVSAVDTANGWLTVTDGSSGRLLVEDLGISLGMVVLLRTKNGASLPSEYTATRMVINEIDITQTKIKLATQFGYDVKGSLSGGSYPGLTDSPLTSDIDLFVYGREGNATGVKLIRCDAYNNSQAGTAFVDYDIELCGGAQLVDCKSRTASIVNADGIAISNSYRTVIDGADLAPAVYGNQARGIIGSTASFWTIRNSKIEGFGDSGIEVAGLKGCLIDETEVINCAMTSGGAAVDITATTGGRVSGLEVSNSEAFPASSGFGLFLQSTATDVLIENSNINGPAGSSPLQLSGSGSVVDNVRENGLRQAEIEGTSGANIGDATHATNVNGKFYGKTVRDFTSTPDRVLMATGPLPTSQWIAFDGSASITPA